MRYPSLTVRYVERPMTLREFLLSLGREYLYTYERNLLGVLVNDRRLWPSARLRRGDRVVMFPIASGG
ncbi:MoaD/ThiS family protein [Candidatus Bathyarchaeota archaeon]|nr:MAG: MoaD/ThiS family protein [Candidatus Bathyarchaeota archaeon]